MLRFSFLLAEGSISYLYAMEYLQPVYTLTSMGHILILRLQQWLWAVSGEVTRLGPVVPPNQFAASYMKRT